MQDVRELRRSLKLTQSELGTQLGVDQSTISRLESGTLEIDKRTQLALEALRSRGRPETQAAA